MKETRGSFPIIESLDGQARDLAMSLMEQVGLDHCTPEDILKHLEAAFSNSPPAALMSEFYCRRQQPGETVLQFGIDLSLLYERAVSGMENQRRRMYLEEKEMNTKKCS